MRSKYGPHRPLLCWPCLRAKNGPPQVRSPATDPEYMETPLRHTAEVKTDHITAYNLFYILDHLRATAEGLDQIPAWFLRITAPVYSAPLAHAFNQSVAAGFVPKQWKISLIKLIIKVPNPTTPADFFCLLCLLRQVQTSDVFTPLVVGLLLSASYNYPSTIIQSSITCRRLPTAIECAHIVPNCWCSHCQMLSTPCLRNNCAKLFQPELCQISIHFNNFWQVDEKWLKLCAI